MTAFEIKLKRAYQAASIDDGIRVLVDRLWPRGVSRDGAAIDYWFKDVAPSTELRKWFAHDVARWPEFQKRYAAELKEHAEELDTLVRLARKGPLTLVFGARDEEHNDAVVLKQVLEGRHRAAR